MAMMQIFQHSVREKVRSTLIHTRYYKSKIDWHKLRPMLIKRINKRANDYPLRAMVPVANQVLEARKVLIQGIWSLMNVIPVKSCKHCSEVYVGNEGHRIKTCHGFKRMKKDQEHKWVDATIDDMVIPKEAFHLKTMFQPIIKHDQRFDYDRISAVLELCSQAGADISKETLKNNNHNLIRDQSLDYVTLEEIGQQTMDAWEKLRLGVKRLLLVYPAKVCEHCSDVHIGPSGNIARVCGVFKFEGWRGTHYWKKAGVDDLIPSNVVWHNRPHDPEVLVDGEQGYYGQAPAVVELCMQAGARIPRKYFCMMKLHGIAPRNIKSKGQ